MLLFILYKLIGTRNGRENAEIESTGIYLKYIFRWKGSHSDSTVLKALKTWGHNYP